MLIEAIGEGVHQISRITEGNLLSERPEIPWEDVIGIRHHIAYGYFDIDADLEETARHRGGGVGNRLSGVGGGDGVS